MITFERTFCSPLSSAVGIGRRLCFASSNGEFIVSSSTYGELPTAVLVIECSVLFLLGNLCADEMIGGGVLLHNFLLCNGILVVVGKRVLIMLSVATFLAVVSFPSVSSSYSSPVSVVDVAGVGVMAFNG